MEERICGKDLWSEDEGAIDGVRVETETVMRWCVQDEVNHEDSEQNEVDETKETADSTVKVMVMQGGWWRTPLHSPVDVRGPSR